MLSISRVRSPKSRSLLSLLAVAHALTLGACDAQSTPGYKGEALMSLRGSVEIADNDIEGKLIPAFAFLAGDYMHIVDVDVHGEFPADFTLDVYAPPPDEADATHEDFCGETGVAIGYITAVTEDHPRTALYADGSSSGGSCDDSGCTLERRWCTQDDAQCYVEQQQCPDSGEDDSQCTVLSTSGDPALKQDRWSQFAGLSENYMIAHLRHDAAKGSCIAHVLGAGKTGLKAGYHLIALRESTAAEGHSGDCETHADQLAIARYNRAHDTQLVDLEFYDYECYPEDDNGCDRARWVELELLSRKAEAELDCPPDDIVATPVPNPEREHISVLVGHDVHTVGN